MIPKSMGAFVLDMEMQCVELREILIRIFILR